MTVVARRDGEFVVDAALLADAFGRSQEEIRDRMRSRAFTSRCEAGVGDDAGRWRLTFLDGNRACRFVVDDAGTLLKRATFPVRTVAGNVGEAPGR